jgi:exodeoxyribonuclease V beta subunit
VNPIGFDPATADLSGLTVIEASAGTGKTHAIQKLVARLVREGVPMPRMLVMSFTNAAADELSQRVRGELQRCAQLDGGAPQRERVALQQALVDFDRACIGTIHGFCQRMLVEHAAEAGPQGLQGWKLQTDETEARMRVCGDAWAAVVEPDVDLAAAVGSFKGVTSGLRGALDLRRERARVQQADFQAARREAMEWLVTLRGPPWGAALANVVANFNSKAKEPAARLLEAARVGAVPDGELGKACEALLDDAKVREAIPKAAVKAAAAQALLASPDWSSMREHLARLADLIEAIEQSAVDTVVRDALRRLIDHRALTRTVVFDDLITRLRDAVRDPSGEMRRALRERFDVVIVDEVQDTDPAQAEILRLTFAESREHRLILVGDPKQSIYAFRNADVDSYMALRGLAGKPIFRLDVSHRSDPALIEGVQRLYAVPAPFLRADIPAMAVESAYSGPRIHGPTGTAPGLALHVTDAGDVDSMLLGVADAIAADLRSGWRIDERRDGLSTGRDLCAGDVAVLCHEHWQGRRIADELQERGIPVVVMDRQSVWASEAAGDALRLLAAIARPWDRAAALGALAGSCTGLRVRQALESPDEWVRTLREAAMRFSRHGVGAALRWLVLEVGPEHGRIAALGGAEGERLFTDLEHVLEELEKAQAEGAASPHALAGWLALRVHGSMSGEDSLCRSLGRDDAVKVMTLHGSKGLTFGVVWLPTFMVPTRKGDHDAAEARRLLYVGLTRARFVTRAVWMPDEAASRSPLAQLLHARGEADEQRLAEVTASRLADPALALQDLQRLSAESGGAITAPPLEPAEQALPVPTGSTRLAPSRALPAIAERAVWLSFTSLSSVKKRAGTDAPERDVDAEASVPREGVPRAVTPMDAALRGVDIHGAALGTLVHDALAEPAAFSALAPGRDIAPLHEALARHAAGLSARSSESLVTLAGALQRALGASTGHEWIVPIAQAACAPGRCLRELDVALPWNAAPARLADILRMEQAPWSERVASVLDRGDAQVRLGSLVGSIDLAVERDGRWFIYDYKTNLVGDDAGAYGPTALHQAMAAELYPLQAALYAAMLTRWLASRGVRSNGSIIGGVGYMFLRGMDPDAGAQGTWVWEPSQRLLQALDDMLPQGVAGGVA